MPWFVARGTVQVIRTPDGREEIDLVTWLIESTPYASEEDAQNAAVDIEAEFSELAVDDENPAKQTMRTVEASDAQSAARKLRGGGS